MTTTPTTTENLIAPHQPHWVSRAAFPVVTGVFFLTEAALFATVHRGVIWLAVPLAF
jgi:hypothetical protein